MSSRATARVAGLLYLAVAVLGAWAHAAGGGLRVPADAGATAANVAGSEALVRWVVVADILMCLAFVFLGLVLRRLLHADDARLASAIVVFTSVSAGTVLVTLVFYTGALALVGNPEYLDAFGAAGRDGLVLLLLDLQASVSVLNGVFFGLWLLPVGVLAYRSALFPRFVGVVVTVGALAWIIGPVLAFALPSSMLWMRTVTSTVAPIGEIVLLLWLLIVGVRTPKAIA